MKKSRYTLTLDKTVKQSVKRAASHYDETEAAFIKRCVSYCLNMLDGKEVDFTVKPQTLKNSTKPKRFGRNSPEEREVLKHMLYMTSIGMSYTHIQRTLAEEYDIHFTVSHIRRLIINEMHYTDL